MAENTSSRPLTTSYTGHPSILQIPHIRLYKLIMLLPCQVNLLAAGKEDAVAVIPRYVRHVDQISPVAAVKATPKLPFQFPVAKPLILKSGFRFFMNPPICSLMASSSSTTAIFKIHHLGFPFQPSPNLSADFLLFWDIGNERHIKWSERHKCSTENPKSALKFFAIHPI